MIKYYSGFVVPDNVKLQRNDGTSRRSLFNSNGSSDCSFIGGFAHESALNSGTKLLITLSEECRS